MGAGHRLPTIACGALLVLLLPVVLTTGCGAAGPAEGGKPGAPAESTATDDRAAAPPPMRQMVVTIDDLPVGPGSYHSLEEQQKITEGLLAVLKRFDVPAIGFVNEGKLETDGKVDPARVAMLEAWLDAGHELGNHGYRHMDLHSEPPQQWMADILRGETVLRPLLAERGTEPRYFRHPFLRTGLSLEVKKETLAFLAEHGYREAPVTIDNQEWIFGGAYAHAESDEERAKIGRAYVDYMEQIVAYYEEQAVAIVGEPIPQTLLLHAYALNADWLGDLFDRLVARGYTFIPLDQALEHPAYALPDEYHGPGGITWLHRWGITQGLPGSTYRGEPAIPEWLAAR